MGVTIKTEIRPNETQLRHIVALSDRGLGVLAMAVEHKRVTRVGTYWHLAGQAEGLPFPVIDTENGARQWVEYLGGLVDAYLGAALPVWCPADARQTAQDAAAHQSERGVAVDE